MATAESFKNGLCPKEEADDTYLYHLVSVHNQRRINTHSGHAIKLRK